MSGLLRETLKSANSNKLQFLARCYCSQQPKPSSQSSPTASVPPSSSSRDAPGLSKRVLDVPKDEVGPGASKKSVYKNPEYFCYHNGSYFEAEVEMLKYRLPQPSNTSVEKK